MKPRLTDISIYSLALSASFFLVSVRPILPGLLNFFHRSSGWEKRLDTIAMILVIYGIVFLLLGVFASFRGLQISTLASQVRQGMNNIFPALKTAWDSFTSYQANLGPDALWAFFALGVGLLVRVYFLPQPMRGDEAYTFLNYVDAHFLSLFDYSYTNNHIFSTILIKISTSLFGGSPAMIRLPVFLAGILTIWLVFYLCRLLVPRQNSGIFAATGIALFPYLILFSTNARGYNLITLFTLLVAILAFRFIEHPSRPKVILLSLLSALGALAMPIMALPVAGIFFWVVCLLFINRVPWKLVLTEFVLPFVVFGVLFALVFYTPVILVTNGLEPIVANRFVQPHTWEEFFRTLAPLSLQFSEQVFRNIPPGLLLTIGFLVVLGLYRSIKDRNWGLALIIPAFFASIALAVVYERQLPYARTLTYLIPFFFILADAGFNAILERMPARVYPVANTVLLSLGLFFAVTLMTGNAITKAPDTSAFPEAPIAVQYLKPILQPGDVVRVINTANWSVYYYFWYDGIPRPISKQGLGTGRIFFIVKKSRYSIQALTDQPVTKLLEVDDMALYQQVEE